MKTICVLNGRIIMSQDGEALLAMESNAAQYAGAIVSVVDDAAYDSLILGQPKLPEETAAEAERQAQRDLLLEAKAPPMFDAIKGANLVQINAWVDNNFGSLNAQQRAFLKLMAVVAGMYLRERQ